ncbi:hypothetical protein LJC33_07910 [Eubacteriales bacterium OttesenSCG-928-N13]|nr:hypothetical protein [Eubacteriales bacterium OttesenSCG-928-N13]
MQSKLLALLLVIMLILSLGTIAMAEVAADDDESMDWVYDDEDEQDAESEMTDEDLAAEDDQDTALSDDIEDADEADLNGALEVYSWFGLQPLDVDESIADSSGTMWRVLDDRFNTADQMLGELHYYFSDEIVDGLWNSSINPYKEIDGYLYTNGEGRSIDERIGEVEMVVTSRSDTKIEMDVTVYYSEPDDEGVTEESFHYVRELEGDTWHYTEFPFFW